MVGGKYVSILRGPWLEKDPCHKWTVDAYMVAE